MLGPWRVNSPVGFAMDVIADRRAARRRTKGDDNPIVRATVDAAD
jgi:hypothetical protein